MKYAFIRRHAGLYLVTMLCRVGVQRSAYYAWRGQPSVVIEPQELALRGRMKALFAASRGSLGSRMLMNNLNQEGLHIPAQADHRFRRKPITHSGPSRSLIPAQADHRSGPSRSLLAPVRTTV